MVLTFGGLSISASHTMMGSFTKRWRRARAASNPLATTAAKANSGSCHRPALKHRWYSTIHSTVLPNLVQRNRRSAGGPSAALMRRILPLMMRGSTAGSPSSSVPASESRESSRNGSHCAYAATGATAARKHTSTRTRPRGSRGRGMPDPRTPLVAPSSLELHASGPTRHAGYRLSHKRVGARTPVQPASKDTIGMTARPSTFSPTRAGRSRITYRCTSDVGSEIGSSNVAFGHGSPSAAATAVRNSAPSLSTST